MNYFSTTSFAIALKVSFSGRKRIFLFMERVQISPCGFICERVTVACVAPFSAVLGAKNEEQRSKTAGKMVQGLVSFSRGQTENPVPRPFFAPKLNGNACYAG